eukprot:TRINITY_DN3702_c0_g1_i1.p1 TRINITY_DN3702_c0_g1~~TRINITY_DN3702_c0_g1_i1.p1  ORF type:complete len:873 (-),score=129.55 TRINITY_DN3702_c0_g1_i1:311-2728(-)
MRALKFAGDIGKLFAEIDADDSGCISMDEFDSHSADLWAAFKRWCASTFSSSKEMVDRLSRSARTPQGRSSFMARSPTAPHKDAENGFTKAQFTATAVRLGWYGSNESVIFDAIDVRGVGTIGQSELNWFDVEKKQYQKRTRCRERMMASGRVQLRTVVSGICALESFCNFLRSMFGCLFKAWREVMDVDCTMYVQRKHYMKVCSDLGWYGDIHAVWRAVDSDDTGQASLADFAPHEARTLAAFKQWASDTFGSAKTCFRAIVREVSRLEKLDGGSSSKGAARRLSSTGRRASSVGRGLQVTAKVSEEEWLRGCGSLGYADEEAQEVFTYLNWEGDDSISFKNLRFLDSWEPAEAWLTAVANPQEAQAVSSMLLDRYGQMVKAWRLCLDPASSGRLGWKEFAKAMIKLGYSGDVAGCWVALDVSKAGFITLQELDASIALELAYFRRWAFAEFGGVLLAFRGLDADDSGSLTSIEFKSGVQAHSYKGDAAAVFNALNIDNDGELCKEEVAFLEEWEMDLFGEVVSSTANASGIRRSSLLSIIESHDNTPAAAAASQAGRSENDRLVPSRGANSGLDRVRFELDVHFQLDRPLSAGQSSSMSSSIKEADFGRLSALERTEPTVLRPSWRPMHGPPLHWIVGPNEAREAFSSHVPAPRVPAASATVAGRPLSARGLAAAVVSRISDHSHPCSSSGVRKDPFVITRPGIAVREDFLMDLGWRHDANTLAASSLSHGAVLRPETVQPAMSVMSAKVQPVSTLLCSKASPRAQRVACAGESWPLRPKSRGASVGAVGRMVDLTPYLAAAV